MSIFSKKRFTELDDVSTMTEEERELALNSLEVRRSEINRELEELMQSIGKLTKNRTIRRRKYKMGDSPNDFSPKKK